MASPVRPLIRAAALALVAMGCRDASSSAPPPPPAADFVIAAGDSVFWVTSASGKVSMRGAPLELARIRGRFYEVYVADDDRSFVDAILMGQRVYRRDLISGDSLLVYQDTIVPRVARQYARLFPDDVRLRPDEEGAEEPIWSATTTVEVADLHGPFLSYTLHTDVEREGAPLWHTSRRGVIDLIRGGPASLSAVAGGQAVEVQRRRAAAAAAVIDSVRDQGGDEDRARAAAVLPSFRLDPYGFGITTTDGAPAVAYALTGEGSGESGHLLSLPAIPIGEPAWWQEVAPSLPITSADGGRDLWRHAPYEVVVRYDSADAPARLSLRDGTSREWTVGRIPAPATRIFWLDHPTLDSVSRRALARAFDEAALYDESVRTAAMWGARGRAGPAPRFARHSRQPPARRTHLRPRRA